MPYKRNVPGIAYPPAAPYTQTKTQQAPSGIAGLDAVLHGGFPLGRTTIVVAGPGGGKTVLATQFLVNGALQFDEPALMISFEESPEATRARTSASSTGAYPKMRHSPAASISAA
jgi:circadian clock protein KaiC